MFHPDDPINKAYWIPVPRQYLLAAGAVTAQWGYFEMQFCGFIKILGRHPNSSDLSRKIPRGFGDKAKLLKRLAKISLIDTPSLVQKICDFTTRANQTCLKRNVIVHGFWFDMSVFDAEKGIEISTEPDGSGDFYSVTLEQLEALSIKISNLKLEGIHLLFNPPHDASSYLTPAELLALREYHNSFPSSPLEPLPFRDPIRKGTPQRPEPFLA
jgi:hypothetical protein